MLRPVTTIHRLAIVAAAWLLCLAGCASTPESTATDRGSSTASVSSTAGVAAKIARDQIGTSYRYGGSDRSGFDCSGLVYYSYRQAGKQVPRTTGQQWAQLQPVARNNLRVGDVLFFRIDGKMSHVGLYVGDGNFVHAPSSGKRVALEELESRFYQQAFIRGGRP